MARILVVDDEISIVMTLKTLLADEGHKVEGVLSGTEAQELIKETKFDLMISDIRMNPINGMELLKFAHEATPCMTVIMLTAYGQVDPAIAAMELGAFEYIKKPFDIEELLATVAKALEFGAMMNE